MLAGLELDGLLSTPVWLLIDCSLGLTPAAIPAIPPPLRSTTRQVSSHVGRSGGTDKTATVVFLQDSR